MTPWTAEDVDLLTTPSKGFNRMRRDKRNYDQVSIGQLVVEAALKKAMPPDLRRKIARGSAGCLMVLTPSQSWLGLVDTVLDEINGELHVVTRSARKKAGEDDGRDISRRLSEGQTVVGVATDESLLPSVFKTLSQHVVHLPSPDHELVAEVIRKVSRTGRISAAFRELDFSALDFDELCGLIVFGGNATTTVARIAEAVLSKTRTARVGEELPDIEHAVEFGEARLWAMDLKRDLEDQRAGLIGAEAVDKGILLSGPPGVGKTLMARSLGQYLGVPVIMASIADYMASGSGYLDSVIKQQRAIFEKARESSPCVLFLDEIDNFPDLGSLDSRNRDWWVPIINDFLTLLDGAASDRSGVIVIGATNRPGHMASLTRPGRLERVVYMGPPDAAGAVRVLRHHLRDDLVGESLDQAAAICASREMTSAEIMELVRASKRAGRRAGRLMILQDIMGRLLPPDDRPEEYKRIVSIHEAGHAVIGQLLLGDQFLSVTMSGGNDRGAGGATFFKVPNVPFETIDHVRDRVLVLLAGRSAEIEILGRPSNGSGGVADSDLGKSVRMLGASYLSYGLGDIPRWRCEPADVMGVLTVDREARQYIETELAAIAEVARDLVRERKAAIEAVATALREKGMLTAGEVMAITMATPLQSEEVGEAA